MGSSAAWRYARGQPEEYSSGIFLPTTQKRPLVCTNMSCTSPCQSTVVHGVTVIDEDTHYFMHVDSDLSPKPPAADLGDTNQGIRHVCSQLSLTITHTIGFDCLCDKPTCHLTLVSTDRKSWVCSEDDTITGTLSHKQKLWLPVETDMDAGSCKYVLFVVCLEET